MPACVLRRSDFSEREPLSFADTLCACGMILPPGGVGFTTAELKRNFMSTVRESGVLCGAKLVHGGRTTQVWDATISAEPPGKLMALFRGTQIILWLK
ncbi:MAG TPA: PaaI family thioesterase [Rhizomicrobium sp.]